MLGERLKALTGFVNQLGGAETRSLWYVDTGPLLERDFAQRAGLGFIGKHTNLISRRFGNWILLAEILTTLELEPDAPEKNHCGNCMRCIAACPTRAITAPFQLDARLCISYLTIELKGSDPGRTASGHRQPDFRLRRLSGGLSVEPVCARRQIDEGARAPGAGRSRI